MLNLVEITKHLKLQEILLFETRKLKTQEVG